MLWYKINHTEHIDVLWNPLGGRVGSDEMRGHVGVNIILQIETLTTKENCKSIIKIVQHIGS